MPRSAGSKVNTISRGATILGIYTVKNICMTSNTNPHKYLIYLVG
ncbi:hypothetical protein [Psychromonas hadalis]